jgi:hypothetical protein
MYLVLTGVTFLTLVIFLRARVVIFELLRYTW